MQEPKTMISKNLRLILERIAKSSTTRHQNITSPVRLVAVSKTKSVEEIMEAYNTGIRHFGENYVEEIEEKQPKLPLDIKWHFIGHLQSNKIKKVCVPNLECIETVDRESLAEKLQKHLKTTRPTPLKILLQVKTSDEESKSGAQPSQVEPLYEYIQKNCPNLQFAGLMTIGKEGDISAFQIMRSLKEQLCSKYALSAQDFELSMGMSSDFQQAIQFGATSVRVGSLIFGTRNYPKKNSQTKIEQASIEKDSEAKLKEKEKSKQKQKNISVSPNKQEKQ